MFRDEKCIKIFDEQNLFTFDEAKNSCLQLDNASSILTIDSKEEQEFISQFLFKTNGILDNIWLGMKRNNNLFKWTDGSELSFTNSAKGNPSNKTEQNCVQMITDSSPIGQWAHQPCNKTGLVVCQKTPTVTISFLHKKLLETSKKLIETQEVLSDTRRQLNKTREESNEFRIQLRESREKSNETTSKLSTYLKNLMTNKWINYKLFTDSDGKHRAFIIPINKNHVFSQYTWNEANNTCAKFNASLVEIQTEEKQFIFESFLGQLGLESNRLKWFWLNAGKDSTGKWKWLRSGKEFKFTNWDTNEPVVDVGYDYLLMIFHKAEGLGKWYNNPSITHYYVVCEVEVIF